MSAMRIGGRQLNDSFRETRQRKFSGYPKATTRGLPLLVESGYSGWQNQRYIADFSVYARPTALAQPDR